eukprot:Lankesteria_metandrocarpae@DN2782_c0_g1_i1.p1
MDLGSLDDLIEDGSGNNSTSTLYTRTPNTYRGQNRNRYHQGGDRDGGGDGGRGQRSWQNRQPDRRRPNAYHRGSDSSWSSNRSEVPPPVHHAPASLTPSADYHSAMRPEEQPTRGGPSSKADHRIATTSALPAQPTTASAGQQSDESRKAWMPRRFAKETRQEQTARQVKSLLNKLTVERFPVIAECIATIADAVETPEDAETIIRSVVGIAIAYPNFGEMFSDTLLIIQYRMHAFFERTSANKAQRSGTPSTVTVPARPPMSEVKGEVKRPASAETSSASRATSFHTTLLNSVQREYGKIPLQLVLADADKALPEDERNLKLVAKKKHALSVCALIAELHVRSLINASALQFIVQDLLSKHDTASTRCDMHTCEHLVEAVCHLLTVAGSHMELKPTTQRFLTQIFSRLAEIRILQRSSPRLHFIIENLFDARKAGWHQKAHQEKAKGLGQILEEVEQAAAVGGAAQAGIVVKLGERENLKNVDYACYMDQQAAKYHRNISPHK